MGWIGAAMERRTFKSWAIIAVVGAVAMSMVLLIGMRTAQASHYGVSLEGSNFEIEDATGTPLPPGANLMRDNPAPSIDWASVSEDRKGDLPTGQADDSFGNGTKEDTAVPAVVDGSIPNNKSDLLNFGVYLEKNASGNFLHLFWHRVQEPTGTTNMDFEFNKSKTLSSNGKTPIRSEGDVLIQYDLSQGGTRPTLWLSRWYTAGPPNNHTKADCEAANALPCWSKKVNLTAQGDATGSINNVAITDDPTVAGDPTDGLATGGTISPRTFGEASIDFDALSSGAGTCTSFGGAYLKSRASDSFTAALKDFIAPLNKDIGNCGRIVVEKVSNGGTGQFNFTTGTLPGGAFSLTTTTAGTAVSKEFASLNAGAYDVAETVPTGWDLTSSACTSTDSADTSTPGNISLSAGETITCRFTNTRQQGSIVIEKVSNGGTGQFNFTTGTLPGGAFSLTTTTAGTAVSKTYNNLSPGTFDVAETVPTGWDLTSSACTSTDSADTSTPGNINLSANETITCRFTNTKQGSIVIEKVSNGGTGQFNFTTGTLPGGAFSLTTTTAGTAVSKTYNNLSPGTFDVAETVPTGWDLTSSACTSTDSADASTPGSISLNAGETITCRFTNTNKTTTISTAQRFVPQDNATISGTGTGTFNGQVDFELYKGACNTGELVYYERNVALPSGGTVSTSNGDVATADHSAFYAITGSGTYHWKVSYHNDTNGHPDATSCVEESSLTIDNDTTTP